MTQPASSPFNIVALGWALSATLVILFVICLAVAIAFPEFPATHAWVALFSPAPMASVRIWIEGIVYSIVCGWISAAVLGTVYNRLLRS
jgi:hypothetical protein